MSTSSENCGGEMRGAVRYPVRWPVQLQNGTAVTRDISATGIYLNSTTTVELASMVSFSVQLPKRTGLLERLECKGLAVRVEQVAAGVFGIGIALQDFHFQF